MKNSIYENLKKLERNHYTRLAGTDNYWCDFKWDKAQRYVKKTNGNFCLIVYGDIKNENDFFVFPWNEVSNTIFTEDNLDINLEPTIKKKRNRWHFTISKDNNEFKLHFSGGGSKHYDVSNYYARKDLIPELSQDLKFDLGIKPGDIISNQQISDIFKCGTQGGMRRSHTTNSLVLISDPTKGLYEDRWAEDILHYTGMGLEGDQKLDFQQNKTLAASKSNGVNLHLFEVFEESQYYYHGEVELVGEPYTESQLDKIGNMRIVYIFPLKIKSTIIKKPISEEIIEKKEELLERKARKLTYEELLRRAMTPRKEIGIREVTIKRPDRDSNVIVLAKINANGICQLCGLPAPFNNKQGEPYLETHHIEWISKGGDDTIENTVALCPNCHRKMHVLDLDKDKEKLKK